MFLTHPSSPASPNDPNVDPSLMSPLTLDPTSKALQRRALLNHGRHQVPQVNGH